MGRRQHSRLVQRRKAAEARSRNGSSKRTAVVAGTVFATAAVGLAGVPGAVASPGDKIAVTAMPELAPGTKDLDPSQLVPLGGDLYFTARDETEGRQLWRMPRSGAPQRLTSRNGQGIQQVGQLVTMGGALYFSATEVGTGDSELWRANGAGLPTEVLSPDDAYIHSLTAVGGTLFFSMDDGTGVSGQELWKSNGTQAGTSMVSDLRVGSGSSHPYGLTAFGSKLAFTASRSGESNVFVTDGSAAGTVELTDSYDGVGYLVAAQNRLYFTMDDGNVGSELWTSTGTVAGTQLVSDLTPGSASTYVSDLTAVGDRVFFTASGPGHSISQLWSTQGATAGVRQVTSLTAAAYVSILAGGTDRVYFSVGPDDAPSQLHSAAAAGGAPVQLTRFTEFEEGVTSSRAEMTSSGTRLWFHADSETYGRELWTSDGTVAGTRIAADVEPGTADSDIDEMAGIGTSLWFEAWTRRRGEEIWRADMAAAADRVVDGPVITAKGKQKQKAKGVKVRIRVGAAESVTTRVSGTVKLKGKSQKLRAVTVRTSANGSGTVTLKGSKKSSKAVLAAVKKWRSAKGKAKKKLTVRARITVRMTDAAGNTYPKTVTVRLT